MKRRKSSCEERKGENILVVNTNKIKKNNGYYHLTIKTQ